MEGEVVTMCYSLRCFSYCRYYSTCRPLLTKMAAAAIMQRLLEKGGGGGGGRGQKKKKENTYSFDMFAFFFPSLESER